ncbi:MAG TPA: tetratricopeptide repeat protein, partial [Pseudonocardiaceae bacterium]|nr:tetratricopeptide repeat protein [Pseudonocardiaceae bacterium]
LSLDVLSPDEAFALFAGVIGADRAQADPAATADVLRLCGYLPLAIRIAAARLRTRSTWPVRTLADRLAESWRDELTVGDRSVTAALDLSYARLGDDERRLFSLLGRHPGVSFESCQVAALGGIGRPDAERLLDELVDTHLLQVAPTPGRYRFHDLVRQYARTATEVEEPVWRMAIGRLLDFYLELALRMAAHLNPDSRHTPTEPAPWPLPDVSDADRAIGWCETELDNLLAAVGYAATEGWGRHAWQLACALPWFFRRRGHTTDWITCLRIGADAADDDNDRANVLRELGIACYHGARFTEAVDVTEHALVLYRGTGDEPGEAAALNNLGNMYDQFDEVDKAVGYYRQALALRRRVHDLRGAAMSLMNLCRTFARIDSFAESLECGQHALDMYREVGDRRGESMTLNNLATLYFRMARLAEAQACGEQAVALNRAMLDRRNEASALDTLGLVHRQLGNYATAVDHHNQALALVREVGNHSIEAEIQANIEDAVRAAADAGKPLT